ncbi:hypothetical protein CR492_19085 [Methylocella silvestris]|uniref:Uncharacterized protein n=2 Tax=Methylocella silvestris TaxID=199596 RepID=A0A2J7TCA3_METSI|nr:hypothetical protein CR492_19085 [Methylocella silvestris]
MKRLTQSLATAGLMLSATQAFAHHSTANYDYTQNVELIGTVKELQWTNPHSFLQVLVPDGKGGAVEWSVETGSPSLDVRLGWSRDMFKPGDTVKVILAPMRSGGPNGTLKSVTLPDGKVLYGPGNQGTLPEGLALPTLEKASPDAAGEKK